MAQTYQPLSAHRLAVGTGYLRPGQSPAGRVTAADPAVSVMTDLSQVQACTTEPSAPLGMARATMIRRGVRLLLVCDDHDQVLGVITSRDIGGNKPARILAKATGCTWDDLRVGDVMTLRARLEVLRMEDVRAARVGDLVATLRQADRQHALVVDRNPTTGSRVVRGIFSLSQIGLQLGLDLDPARRPTTYAELVQAGWAL